MSYDNFFSKVFYLQTIKYNKIIAEHLNPQSALVLGALVSLDNTSVYEGKKDGEIITKKEKIIKDTCLSKRDVDMAIQELIDVNFLNVEKIKKVSSDRIFKSENYVKYKINKDTIENFLCKNMKDIYY